MASVWAIGDVHGEAEKLNMLLDALPRGPEDYTVFMGDYIDRGPDSAGSVRRVLKEYHAAPERTVLLWGNHEDMAAFRYEFDRPSTFAYDDFDWYRNGGIDAMKSFGYDIPDMFQAPCPPELAELFPLLRTYWNAPKDRFPELANVLWVHAGVLPNKEVGELNGDTLLWVRQEFLHYPDMLGRLVIHGHTPVRHVRVEPDKIGIDTGAVFGGPLTALRMPERLLYQTGEDAVIESPLPEPH